MTTVTISDKTHRKLKMLKEEREADSFDSLLNEIAEEELDIPSTDEMFGAMEGIKKGEIREHRDRTERWTE
ncbi:MAG: hypothetical protein ABEJ03_05820 [Candidatus Nanohaloarchaea archaeon]